jgi:hypothetical protein
MSVRQFTILAYLDLTYVEPLAFLNRRGHIFF